MIPDQVMAVIFARGGSKGVHRKNIRPLLGKPLIVFSIEVAKASPSIQGVIVSTDDEEIAEVARAHGAEVPFMRPTELATDDAPEWKAWQHAITTLRSQGRALDLMVSLPCTCPLRRVEEVEACIREVLDSDADAAITITPAAKTPYFGMVSLQDGEAHPFMPVSPPVARRQDAPPVYAIAGSVYAVRPNFVLGASHLFEGKVKGVVVSRERAVDIDCNLDFDFAEFLLKRWET